MTDISAVGQFAWLLLVLPLVGAVILLVAGKAANKWGHLLGCATVLAAFVYGVILFFDTTSHAADVIQRQVRLLAFGDYYPLEFRFNEQTRFLAIARIMNDFDVRLRIVAGSFRRNAWKDILED